MYVFRNCVNFHVKRDEFNISFLFRIALKCKFRIIYDVCGKVFSHTTTMIYQEM